jgi:hypothetical protein
MNMEIFLLLNLKIKKREANDVNNSDEKFQEQIVVR